MVSVRGEDKPLAVVQRRGRDRFLSATDAFLAELGLSADDLVSAPVEEVLPKAAAAAIAEACTLARADGRPRDLRDLHCIEGVHVPVDVTVRASDDQPDRFELALIRTERTRQTLDALAASLLRPTDPDLPSMLFISDVRNRSVRALHNNLTTVLGLPNRFTYEAFQDATHPEDVVQDEQYLKQRLELSDRQYATFAQRMRDTDNEWRIVTGRTRVLERAADGTPVKTLGFVTDSTAFNEINQALLRATEGLANAEQEERRRLGRDLHDTVGQWLTAARLILASLRQAPDGPQPSGAALADLSDLIVKAQEEIRSSAFLLHPPDLADLGLVHALDRLCTGLAPRFRLPISFGSRCVRERFHPQIEYALYRVAQEALMNVHMHASASQVEVRVEEQRSVLSLSIADDGVGLPPFAARARAGVGIAGMRARLTQIGGRLSLLNQNPGLKVTAMTRFA